MLSLEEWQSDIRPNVPNNWTIFVVYLDIWPMKRLRRGQSLFWVARYFLICDDKTMTFAEQQDKSFDNSPLEEAVDLFHKWYHLRPRHLKSPLQA